LNLARSIPKALVIIMHSFVDAAPHLDGVLSKEGSGATMARCL